jgi:hypothetical protein
MGEQIASDGKRCSEEQNDTAILLICIPAESRHRREQTIRQVPESENPHGGGGS